ncbi:MAG: bifunctional [glutamate--ammonia ligase]-adenylyl-L-tyrosine phosphorylase/[glutamate--ammonia-ligase] adenylyltransferase [Nitrospinae bacterium]|nr:bifunctional [glutamate--ammonia ligase]-adenylyl-L-tyrosine phosphorylase/[glutamate--ammonia-ligase] adenylyltransferase [Nitrospinota bacterium]
MHTQLNFSSDIDLLYLYSLDAGETTELRIPIHEFCTKLAEQVTQAIDKVTPEGTVFRVDLRLRPWGQRGTLAYPLRSLERYYEGWGQPWERAALLKARPVAGSPRLGAQFLTMIEPFVFRKYLDHSAFTELWEMKARIERAVERKGGAGRDIKRGPGGIRELEFFVQAHQLVYGGTQPALRESNSLRALEKLRRHGFLAEQACEELSQAYRVLRTLEHRLQMVHGLQTHSLPTQRAELARLAHSMGYRGETPEAGIRQLEAALALHTERVRESFERLFQTMPPPPVSRAQPHFAEALTLPEDVAIPQFQTLGFRRPTEAYRQLAGLGDPRRFPHASQRTRSLWNRLRPLLLEKVLGTPDPDLALTQFEQFFARVGGRWTYLSLLLDNPATFDLLVKLFGTSQFVAGLFLDHPELLDVLVGTDALAIPLEAEALRAELADSLWAVPTYEEKLDTLRRCKDVQLLRVALRHLAGQEEIEWVTGRLTDIADVCLQAVYTLAREALQARYGVPLFWSAEGGWKEAEFAVIGLGKLGGRELTYYSDLDLLFMYSPEEGGAEDEAEAPAPSPLAASSLTRHAYFYKLAQRVISMLTLYTGQGRLYAIDARLRPSGNAGALVTSLPAFVRYQAQRAHLWEHQTLIKGRFICGAAALGQRVIEAAHRFSYTPHEREPLRREIDHCRHRMETELGQEGKGRRHVKYGFGGLVDVEFLTQFYQLQYGAGAPGVRKPNTLDALRALQESGVLSSADAALLTHGYRFLRQLELGLQLLFGRAHHELPSAESEVRKVSKVMGFRPAETGEAAGFLEHYTTLTTHIRSVYTRLLARAEG